MLFAERINNPERYIRAQYYYGVRGHALAVGPFCNTFIHEQALKKFRNYDMRADAYLAQRRASDENTFRCELALLSEHKRDLTDQAAWDRVLRDPTIELTPLFRYAVAASTALPATGQLYYEQAFDQFMCDPIGYDSPWDQMIPCYFVKECCNVLHVLNLRRPLWQ
jgi:hypothetical protein